MKTTLKILAVSLAGGLWATAQTTTTETTETNVTPGGEVTETTTTTTTFTPAIQGRVVEYFEEFKTEKHGLPPALVKRVNFEKLPRTWVTARVEPGVVITEEQREFLAPPPEPLIKVLPKLTKETHQYYVMGGNVVAVDTETYTVVDSVRIPSVKIAVD